MRKSKIKKFCLYLVKRLAVKRATNFFESTKFIFCAFFFLFSFLFFSFDVFSQPGTWVSVYGGTNYDRGKGIAQTVDKGYIVCGPTSSYGIGNTDMYLLKIDSLGKFQWHKTFGGKNIENCFSVKQTNDSGFVICGYTNSFGRGGYDFYLVKTDHSGNLQWEKTFGGSNWDFAYWAEQTSDGGYIIAGETFSFGNNSQAYLVKTDSNGDTLWTRSFGETKEEAVYEVHETSDNGYILAGYRTTDTTNKDFYVIKTDLNGNVVWKKIAGGITDDKCNSVALCADGGFLLGGYTLIAGVEKISFMKMNSAGTVLFSSVDTNAAGSKSITRIRETKDGQFVTLINSNQGGLGGQEIFLNKWNTIWNVWVRTFGGTKDEEGYDLVQCPDSGFALVGYTETFGTGPDNIFIVRTNKTGNYNSVTNIYVGMQEVSEVSDNTLIYPNPFSETLFLKIDKNMFSDEKIFLVEIFDVYGQKIMSTEQEFSSFSSGPVQIDIKSGNFSPGFYIVSLQSGNKKINRKLLFVR